MPGPCCFALLIHGAAIGKQTKSKRGLLTIPQHACVSVAFIVSVSLTHVFGGLESPGPPQAKERRSSCHYH